MTSAVRPKAIDTAFQLDLAGIVLYALGFVVNTLMDREHLVRLIRDALTGTGQPFTEDDVLRLLTPFRVAGGITIALLTGLLILVAVATRHGRNWARLLLAVVAAFGMVNFLAGVTSGGVALDELWNLAAVAFVTAGVVYQFRPESSRYFTGRKR
jgi:hypothetical protein